MSSSFNPYIYIVSHVEKQLWEAQHLRQRAVELQQPYQEEEDYIIGRFLFEKARLKEKEILNQMWNKRKKELEEISYKNEY